MDKYVKIQSRDFWFKVVEMLQQNWALIDTFSNGSCKVFFVSDDSGVFDEMDFISIEEAISSLKRNGFSRYIDDLNSQEFIRPPKPPFYFREHPNGPIYSSGRFWH